MFNPYTESRRIVQSGMDIRVIAEVVKEMVDSCWDATPESSEPFFNLGEFDTKLRDLAQEVEYLQRTRI